MTPALISFPKERTSWTGEGRGSMTNWGKRRSSLFNEPEKRICQEREVEELFPLKDPP